MGRGAGPESNGFSDDLPDELPDGGAATGVPLGRGEVAVVGPGAELGGVAGCEVVSAPVGFGGFAAT